MSNIIDKIQLSGVTYQIQGSGGGGKAIEAGRGISITTGETADTVSFNLPISAGTTSDSIVEGSNNNKASGSYSHAEGYNTKANGYTSHAEGTSTIASGSSSHAEGNNTTANGDQSHAEGYYTTASGNYSHAEGYYTIASGISSHAEGFYTTASGNQSHAEGNNTTASGYCSHSEGKNTIANNQSEHASGQYNVSSSASTTFGDSGNTLFSVGNGTAANARHNAFEIRQNGDIYLSSGGTDIKLQDHLGGGGSVTVDTELDSGSTNPVQNKVIYNKIDEVEEVTAAGLNALNDKITPTVELTQAQYDALVDKDPNTYYIITDAQAGDLTQYWTSAQTNSAITQATSGKQETLVSGTNIKTINNESILGSGNIDIQGGSTYTAGRGISIANDTISFDLPIYKTVSGTDFSLVLNTYSEPSANTYKAKYNTYINCINPYVAVNSGTRNLIMGEACSAMSYTSESFVGGYNSKIGDMRTFAFGGRSEALSVGAVAFGYDGQSFKPQVSKGYGSFACGGGTSANTEYSFATGYHNFTTRRSEFASGQYNNSVSATTTFGDSGNTLFSVGNGTADNARHNAFEIRQNGDIYLTKDGQDVKLQDQLGGSSITVDTALDSGSTNPVENRVIYNKIDEVEQVTAASLNALNDNFGGLKLVKLSQAEYNALATKDSSTLYIIVN